VKKTVLFMIDSLYGSPSPDADPSKWNSAPFNGWWPASLFLSQDGVALDSVGFDFMNNEWGMRANSDNYLHEAALANSPPSGIVYAPNGDGARLASLGVHEHWNNSTNKQYSRNLSPTGEGIELLSVQAVPGITVALTNPPNGAVLDYGTPVLLAAAITNSFSTVTQVQFFASVRSSAWPPPVPLLSPGPMPGRAPGIYRHRGGRRPVSWHLGGGEDHHPGHDPLAPMILTQPVPQLANAGDGPLSLPPPGHGPHPFHSGARILCPSPGLSARRSR